MHDTAMTKAISPLFLINKPTLQPLIHTIHLLKSLVSQKKRLTHKSKNKEKCIKSILKNVDLMLFLFL